MYPHTCIPPPPPPIKHHICTHTYVPPSGPPNTTPKTTTGTLPPAPRRPLRAPLPGRLPAARQGQPPHLVIEPAAGLRVAPGPDVDGGCVDIYTHVSGCGRFIPEILTHTTTINHHRRRRRQQQQQRSDQGTEAGGGRGGPVRGRGDGDGDGRERGERGERGDVFIGRNLYRFFSRARRLCLLRCLSVARSSQCPSLILILKNRNHKNKQTKTGGGDAAV